MYSLFILTVIACSLSLLLTPALRDWSLRSGLVDRPDNGRKLHSVPTPRTGGIPILLSYAGTYAIFLILPLSGSTMIAEHLATILRLCPPVILMFATGLLDDWRNLKPYQKLLGQAVAAIWAYAAGVRIETIGGYALAPWCSFPLTVAWLILCSNAFNLIDGIDGLATGVGVTATLTIFIAGLFHGDLMLGLATAPLAGCLLGFLRYNFNPASIFLGDSGSLLIGFLLGSYGIIWTQKSATMLGMAAPAMALGLPLLEVALSIARRFLSNEPIFTPDRGHIHHQLLGRGLPPRRVALLLYGACGLGATLSLLQNALQNRFAGVVLVLFAVLACFGVQSLGYVEFSATARFLRRRLRPLLGAHVKIGSLERRLASASSVKECWIALETTAHALGYSHICSRLGGVRYGSARQSHEDAAFWQLRLNLPGHDYVNVTQSEGNFKEPILIMPFIDTVRRVLSERLASLPQRVPAQTALNSRTSTVISSDCGAPSVNAVTAS